MEIGRIRGATRVIGKSQGYYGLPLRDETVNDGVTGPGTPSMVTAWFPSPDELASLNAGAPIHLRIIGTGHPPVMLSAGPLPIDDDRIERPASTVPLPDRLRAHAIGYREGSIYVMKHTGREQRETFYPAVSIMMTHHDVMAWYAEKLGLAVAAVPRTPDGWRDQHSVRIHGKRAIALCERLRPYLKVKREQAELVAAFPFEDRRGRSPKGRSLGPVIVARRAELRKQVNALNVRGTQ